MTEKQNSLPDWFDEVPREKSYRSIFKFGDPKIFHHPSPKMVQAMIKRLNLPDEQFKQKVSTGNEVIDFEFSTGIDQVHVQAFQEMVGSKNVSTETFERIKFSTGQAAEEALRLRDHQVDYVTDLVLHPRTKEEIAEIVAYCNQHLIPVYVYGGGSSVTLGLRPAKGGVTVVLSTHLNKIIELNELNQTVTVQAGILGPDLEEALNDAPRRFGSQHAYTCGHFPQSFLHSSVGGWFVTLGSGQQSTYYGDAVDLVLAVEVVTPVGTIRTWDFPASACGPNVMEFAFAYSGFSGSLIDQLITLLGFKPDQRCLCLATADGDKSFTRNVQRRMKSICKKRGAFYLGGSPAKIWEKGRFTVAEREDLMDYGVLIDTLETSVKWDNLHEIHQKVRAYIKNRPDTMCATHASHFYPQGTNLYFIYSFVGTNIEEYLEFQQGIIDTIVESGGTPSHHHGIGRLASPVIETYLGKENMDVLKALKRYFDPNNIMNPGGVLGIS
ncbi:MAG: FAD-binding oxidoreductase [Anaerolineales bacterium]